MSTSVEGSSWPCFQDCAGWSTVSYPLAIKKCEQWSAQLHAVNPCDECDKLRTSAATATGTTRAAMLVSWHRHLSGEGVTTAGPMVTRIKRVAWFASWAFWLLGLFGYAGVAVPYLTSDDAFLYLRGNPAEGGWGFNYAMVVAVCLSLVSLLLHMRGSRYPI